MFFSNFDGWNSYDRKRFLMTINDRVKEGYVYKDFISQDIFTSH